ncbi:MFS transporter, partial [Bacillus sp. B-TM1]
MLVIRVSLLPIIPEATATNPTIPFDKAPAILSSNGRIDSVTASLRVPFFYFPQQLIFLSALMTITDSVEYGQWKNGTRNEAVTLSIRPLLDKIAGALSNGIVGFVAVASGMIGNSDTRITSTEIFCCNVHFRYPLL